MPKAIINRRNFLRLAALTVIGLGAVIIHRRTSPVGFVNYFRWMARGIRQRLFGTSSVVALGECPTYDTNLLACLRSLWQHAEMPNVRGKRVLVKPNLVDYIDDHPATTAPQVVGAIIDLLLELGADKVVVGDGPAFRREAQPVVEASALAPLAARNLQFVDLNYDDPRPVMVREGWLRRSPVFWLPRHVRESRFDRIGTENEGAPLGRSIIKPEKLIGRCARGPLRLAQKHYTH